MSDNPVPEALAAIATKIDFLSQKIDALTKSTGERFARIDQQITETRAQLGVKIEAVQTKVVQVFDEVIAMREGSQRNATEHKAFTKRLDNHDARILALEKPRTRKS